MCHCVFYTSDDVIAVAEYLAAFDGITLVERRTPSMANNKWARAIMQTGIFSVNILSY